MSQLYTSSRLKVLRECLRKHHYQYELGIRTPATESMLFGTVTHAALEAYFLAWKRGDRTGRLRAAFAAIASSTLSPLEQVRVRILVIAYDARWGAEDWDIVAVEVQFRYELDGYVIGGKIDAIVRDRADGRVYVLEHKTTRSDASPGSAYWERLAVDSQVSIYIDGATVLGYEIAGCIYDVLKRPQHDPKLATPVAEREYTKGKGCSACGGSAGGKKGIVQGSGKIRVAFASEVKVNDCDGCAGTGWKLDEDGNPQAPRLVARQRETDETIAEYEDRLVDLLAEKPDDYLIRSKVVRLEDELPAMRRDLLDTIRLERASNLLFGAEPPRNPDACAKYGGLCPFFGPCSGRASINDKHLFPRGEAHPELAAA